ncbi:MULTISPECIES: hypothetical protein [unclassified Variovorax]|uniref:hypothetical protein n=1 Tax=unclassified Variovorax TaxID=663243 RepID=UPI00076CD4BD|nr:MULTISPECIES: hypothetical protein [unclassified Variovorax]KWT87461.1 hypothetical protein APY03_3749 [Variovorax sp. WDL1]
MAAILARQGVRFDDVEWVKAGGVLQRFEVLHVNGSVSGGVAQFVFLEHDLHRARERLHWNLQRARQAVPVISASRPPSQP